MGWNNDVIVANIYASQDLASKKALWENLLTTLDRTSGLWVMFGGFNLVRLSDDRKGSNFLQIDADVFNDFIHRSGLVELQMGGRRFTRISRDEAKLSKLDRFFVSSELINLRPNAHVVCLYCGLSDHCPLLLHVETHDFGPCPFKLFNSWLDIPSLEVIVKKVWSTSLFNPRPNVVFQSELKALKLSIKSWCKVKDEKNGSTFNSLTDQMAKFDKVAEDRNLLEVAMHLEVHRKQLEFNKTKSLDLKQKSRVK
nr:hypothetical protein [Tanacetum cinerariifolium]